MAHEGNSISHPEIALADRLYVHSLGIGKQTRWSSYQTMAIEPAKQTTPIFGVCAIGMRMRRHSILCVACPPQAVTRRQSLWISGLYRFWGIRLDFVRRRDPNRCVSREIET